MRVGNHAAKEMLPDWLKLDAEYRLRSVYINPLDLSGEVVRDTRWAEQRLRLDIGFKVPKTGAIYIQLDVLDGVLMGDNGDPGTLSQFGVGIATQRPNNVGYDTLVIPGEDPVNPDSYAPRLRESLSHSSESRLRRSLFAHRTLARGAYALPPRWGEPCCTRRGSTQPMGSEFILAYCRPSPFLRPSLDEAVRFGEWRGVHPPICPSTTGFSFLVDTTGWFRMTCTPHRTIWSNGSRVLVSQRDDAGALSIRDFRLSSNLVYRFGEEFDTDVMGFPQAVSGWFGPLYMEGSVVYLAGTTAEISEGFAVQPRSCYPECECDGRARRTHYRIGPVDLGVDFDYASGRRRPTDRNGPNDVQLRQRLQCGTVAV